MAKRDSTLVVGAGISGLSAAVLLARAGHSVELWEGDASPGGMLAGISFLGLPYDRGSHRIHPESHPLLRELTAAESWEVRPRAGRLLLSGRAVPYPLDPGAFLRGIGPRAATSMAWGWLRRPGAFAAFRAWEDDRREAGEPDEGFEDFVVRRVGHSAYERFYRPYVEKVWGLPPDQLSRTVAKQRVSTSAPLDTFRRSVRRQGTTDRTFLYPRGGMDALIRRLSTMADALGVVRHVGRRFDPDADASAWQAVLYSGRLGDLVPSAGLTHRGLYLIHVAVPRGSVPPHDTWYAPGSEFWFGRVSQPARFSDSLQAEAHDVLCIEVPEGRWGPDVDFTQRLDTLSDQLQAAGILPPECPIVDAHQTWLPTVYPMYRRGWLAHWQAALEAVVARGNVFPIGRQGLFLHCNMDHCVYISDEAVRHVESGGDARAWATRCRDFLDLRVRD